MDKREFEELKKALKEVGEIESKKKEEKDNNSSDLIYASSGILLNKDSAISYLDSLYDLTNKLKKENDITAYSKVIDEIKSIKHQLHLTRSMLDKVRDKKINIM